MREWPKQRDCKIFYGNPVGAGGAAVSPEWYKRHIVTVSPTWPMKMGDIVIKRIPFHRQCADALSDIFRDIRATLSIEEINAAGLNVFSGSYNFRPMRGGTALSMHAFGCAIDFDAPRNGLGDRTPELAKHPRVIEIFRSYGAVWGGDWDGDGDTLDERRCDGMHFQFARLG